MKRTILLIFIALITAIGCQAQEADATKTARYNNRHTMDGYKAFYETGYFWGIDNPNGPHLPNKFSVTTSQGFQLNNFVYFGIGAGIDSYRHNENCYISVPLFADLRVNCLNDKRVMPFFGLSRNLVGINFRHPNVMPNFAVWKTITYRHWHKWCCQPRF